MNIDSLDDDDSKIEYIKITVGNSKVFQVNKEWLLNMSSVCKIALEQESSCTTLIFPKINPDAFEKIVEYINYHKTPGQLPVKPARSKNFKQCVEDERDADFIDSLWGDATKRKIFFDILHDANYLDIQCLLQNFACKVGSVIMGISENPPETLKSRLTDILDPLHLMDSQRTTDPQDEFKK